MNNTAFNLEEYLSQGVEKIVRRIVTTSVFHPKESIFMTKFALSSKQAAERRHTYEEKGEHIPPFLIASITSRCNLHCAGCYARSLETCTDGEMPHQLSADEWSSIFEEAHELGISFILLAGGEPLIRKDVIQKASEFSEILFPIFTNGTMLNDEYLKLFDDHRNLVPILSIEGGETKTDSRRGEGIFKKLNEGMKKMQKKRIAFGASITVTTENLEEVTSDDFISKLEESGCKAIIYVEFVPTNHSLKTLAPGEKERVIFEKRINDIRSVNDSMLFISFPGDEKSSEGCLAAGRGFFHINPIGGAEPCPFSPYSDMNVRDTSLRQAMNSKLFRALRSTDMLVEDHDGGCVLFEKREQVEAIINSVD